MIKIDNSPLRNVKCDSEIHDESSDQITALSMIRVAKLVIELPESGKREAIQNKRGPRVIKKQQINWFYDLMRKPEEMVETYLKSFLYEKFEAAAEVKNWRMFVRGKDDNLHLIVTEEQAIKHVKEGCQIVMKKVVKTPPKAKPGPFGKATKISQVIDKLFTVARSSKRI